MLWMIISHIQRGDEIRNFAVALKDELKTIGLPNFNNAKQNNDLGKEARTITDLIDKTRRSLRQDIKNLHNVSEKTSQQVEKLNNNLSDRAAKFLGVTQEINQRTSKLEKMATERFTANPVIAPTSAALISKVDSIQSTSLAKSALSNTCLLYTSDAADE